MSTKYTTIQQHEPLRVPPGWDAQEKKLIAQLEEIFDDLYRRFNRIRLNDLSESLRSTIISGKDGLLELTQAHDRLAVRVEGLQGTADYTQYSGPAHEGLNIGDKWEQMAAPAKTWADLEKLTWAEIGGMLWGDIYTDTIRTHVWDGSAWVLISDSKALSEMPSRLSEVESAFIQRTDLLALQVKEVSEATPQRLRNSSVLIDINGVSVTGGRVTIEANSHLVIESGGTVQISAGNSEDSFINFGEAFSVSAEGMSAQNASFGSLMVAGKKVLTEGSLPSRVVVSATEPTGSGLIWLKPETVSTAEYKADTGVNRNKFFYEADQTLSLAAQSSDTMTSGTFAYRVAFTVLLINDGSAEKNVVFTVSAAKGTKQVNFPAYTLPSIKAWQQVDVEIEVESTTSLCDDTGAINVTIGAANLTANHLCLQKNTQVMLTVTNRSTSGAVQPCGIYYKP